MGGVSSFIGNTSLQAVDCLPSRLPADRTPVYWGCPRGTPTRPRRGPGQWLVLADALDDDAVEDVPGALVEDRQPRVGERPPRPGQADVAVGHAVAAGVLGQRDAVATVAADEVIGAVGGG